MGKLYFVISPEDGGWIARGLQHNVVTYGHTLAEVRDNIDAVVWAYREKNALENLPPSDFQYWAKFIEAQKTGRNLDDHLPPVPHQEDYTRELIPA